MSVIKIVMIEEDNEFRSKMAMKLDNELRGKVNTEEFTDIKYFLDARSEIGDIDILLVSEEFLEELRNAETAKYVFVLTSERQELKRNDGFYNLMKYSSPAEIFKDILRVTNINAVSSVQSDVIMFYSPLGSCGKTSLSLAVGQIMAVDQVSDVLYINLESLCSLGAYLPDVQLSDDQLDSAIRSGDLRVWGTIKSNISTKEHFSYLKPFNDIGSMLDLKPENFAFLIKLIKKTNLYQHIIIDMSSDVNYRLSSLMNECEKILIICEQNDYSAYKIDSFLSVIPPNKQFMFVCNKYDGSKPNYLKSSSVLSRQSFLDAIPLLDIRKNKEAVSVLASAKSVKALANALM